MAFLCPYISDSVFDVLMYAEVYHVTTINHINQLNSPHFQTKKMGRAHPTIHPKHIP